MTDKTKGFMALRDAGICQSCGTKAGPGNVCSYGWCWPCNAKFTALSGKLGNPEAQSQDLEITERFR